MTQSHQCSDGCLQIYAPFSAWAALSASILAGVVFAVSDIGLSWALRGISPWTSLRMIGAIVLGPATVASSDTFDPGVALVAILTHFTLSTIYGTVLALLLPAADIAWGVLLGGFYGLGLYYVNCYGLNTFSPWFAEQRDWVSIVSHFVFGAVLAYAYTALNSRRVGRPTTNRATAVFHESFAAGTLDSNGEDSDLVCTGRPKRASPRLISIGPSVDRRNLPSPGHSASPISGAFCPRLSEAKHFLPLLRSHLAAAAARCPLPIGVTIELLPLVDDGLFGYELVPDRNAHTYITLGCNAHGEPMLRSTVYGDAVNAPRLAASEGQFLSRSERARHYGTQHRDSRFSTWASAAEAAWAQLVYLLPGRPRQPAAIHDYRHRCLDVALSVAHAHLPHWNPFIEFCGLPNEAQQGFALRGANGEHGELIFQRPDIWMLRWKAPPHAIYESWSVVLPDRDAASDRALRNRAS